MQGLHLHTPNWVHWHKPDWHAVGVSVGHVVHDRRFWAVLALIVLFGLAIAAVVLSETGGASTPRPYPPTYPYMP